MAQNRIRHQGKNLPLEFGVENSKVTSGTGHVTPNRSPLEVKVDLKASKITKPTIEKYPDLRTQKSVNIKTSTGESKTITLLVDRSMMFRDPHLNSLYCFRALPIILFKIIFFFR